MDLKCQVGNDGGSFTLVLLFLLPVSPSGSYTHVHHTHEYIWRRAEGPRVKATYTSTTTILILSRFVFRWVYSLRPRLRSSRKRTEARLGTVETQGNPSRKNLIPFYNKRRGEKNATDWSVMGRWGNRSKIGILNSEFFQILDSTGESLSILIQWKPSSPEVLIPLRRRSFGFSRWRKCHFANGNAREPAHLYRASRWFECDVLGHFSIIQGGRSGGRITFCF